MTRLGRVVLATACLLASGCASTGREPSQSSTADQELPDPPWRTEPRLAPTGINAGILETFESVPHDGCHPMGVDTALWEPPDDIDFLGFSYLMRYGVDNTPTKQRMREEGDRNIVEWSDGSLSANVLLVDGTYRLQVEIPVDSTGLPGDWCTYVYGATAPDATGDVIISSLRFIDLDDRSRVPTAEEQR